VWYCDTEKTSGNNVIQRKYFKIEKHPALIKPWISTKSSKYTILEKLDITKIKLAELDAAVNPDPDYELRAGLITEYEIYIKM